MWPTSARDFTNVVHWRQLTNGSIVIVSFSEKLEDLKPIEDGTIRAELILGGYVLKSTFTGTSVNYVVQVYIHTNIHMRTHTLLMCSNLLQSHVHALLRLCSR